MPRERVLLIASGTQAERMSALTRLAAGTHPVTAPRPGATPSSSPAGIIPGNDRPVFDMMADLLRAGVDLVPASPTAASTRAATRTGTSSGG